MHVRVINDLSNTDKDAGSTAASPSSLLCFSCASFDPCYSCEPDGTCVVGVSQCCPKYPSPF
jgi:hypothetical protein